MNLSSFFPTVTGYYPDITATDVDSLPLIEVRFNVDIDENEINTDEKLNSRVTLTKESSEETVPLVFIDYSRRVLSFKPAENLEEGEYYRVIIKSGLLSFDGRAMQYNHTFSFVVSANDIPAPTLAYPGNNTSFSTTPTFSWQPISYDTEETINYRIQVDTSTAFNTIGTNGWETVSTATSGLPSISFNPGTSYFWRVRAELVSGSTEYYGDWSEVRTFYFGTEEQPSPSVQQTYAETNEFYLATSVTDDGASNLAEFPDLRFIFSSAVNAATSGAIRVTREYVDGYPNSNKIDVNFTADISGEIVTINITDTVVPNNRYTITFSTELANTSGEQLAKPVSVYFTSRYSPLYISSTVIRARFGSLLVNYPEDLINFHIYRVSLELNRYIDYADSNPTEDSIRREESTITAPMLRWVEHRTAAVLLTMKFYELLEEVDRSRKLGDYSESRSSNLLAEINNARKKEEEDARLWLAQVGKRTTPKTVVKSTNWQSSRKHNDLSIQHLIRDF